jgi:hypothetical protein
MGTNLSIRCQKQFIEPMYALSVQKLPEGKEWL